MTKWQITHSLSLSRMSDAGSRGEGSPIWPIRGCTVGHGMLSFDLSVLNRAYNLVRVCQQGIACTNDLIC